MSVRDAANFPEDVLKVIDQIQKVVKDFADTTISSSEATIKIVTSDIESWTLKDFARYFADKCPQFDIPFVLQFNRDVSGIKSIKENLMIAARGGNKDLKQYIDWAFDNRNMIINKDKYFTIGTIAKHINLFLQSLPDDDNYRPSWGEKLLPLMIGEYQKNKAVGLLVRFGIPLTAAFMRMAKLQDSQIKSGIGDRLTGLVSDKEYQVIAKIARQSTNCSPYPDNFFMIDWRDEFSPIWDISGCKTQSWWHEDFVGQPYTEYDEFKKYNDSL